MSPKTQTPNLQSLAIQGLSALSLSFALSACGTDPTSSEATTQEPQSKVISKSKAPEGTTDASFALACESKGGLVEWHGACAGTNSCKGESFSSGTISTHDCKASNSCPGVTCLTALPDQGKSGAEIYATDCALCHGPAQIGFLHFITPTEDSVGYITVSQQSQASLEAKVLFGIQGITAEGRAYRHMPGFKETLSLTETRKVISYIQTLEPTFKKITPP